MQEHLARLDYVVRSVHVDHLVHLAQEGRLEIREHRVNPEQRDSKGKEGSLVRLAHLGISKN